MYRAKLSQSCHFFHFCWLCQVRASPLTWCSFFAGACLGTAEKQKKPGKSPEFSTGARSINVVLSAVPVTLGGQHALANVGLLKRIVDITR